MLLKRPLIYIKQLSYLLQLQIKYKKKARKILLIRKRFTKKKILMEKVYESEDKCIISTYDKAHIIAQIDASA